MHFNNSTELEEYLNGELAALQRRVADRVLTKEEERAVEADFMMSFVYEPIVSALRGISLLGDANPVSIKAFRRMQKVAAEVFPYWVDNDLLFAKGRRVLDIISLTGREVPSGEALDSMLAELAEKYYGIDGVSVILPTYNGVRFLRDAMDSVLKQSFPKLELIVVDDASDTQEIAKIVAEYKDERVRYIRNPKNVGLAHSRNVGIRASKYDYVAFCDDDDICLPDKLEKQIISLLEAPQGTGFAYCEAHYIRMGDEEDLYIPRRDISAVRKEGYIYPELLRRNMISGTTLLIKKKCFENIGYYNESLSVFEDWDILLRLSKEYGAAFVPEPLYDYYERPQSLTTRRDEAWYNRVKASLADMNVRINAERRRYGLDEGDIV